MPEVLIVMNIKLEFNLDHVIEIDNLNYSFTDQIANLHLSPYSQTDLMLFRVVSN